MPPRKSKTAAKRTRTPRPPRATPEQPPAAPPPNPDFEMVDGGDVRWKMGAETYWLKRDKMTIEVFFDLDWKRLGGGSESAVSILEATTLVATTVGERTAKLASLKAANDANNEWIMSWYGDLFAACEMEERPFPRAHAPAWILGINVMPKLLSHLAGPPPPGVE